jgi:hypothetical protein
MSRVVSIEQSEPGLYLVNVQHSKSQSLGKILESIAHPPIDDEERSSSNGMRRDGAETPRNGAAGSSLVEKRRRPNGH